MMTTAKMVWAATLVIALGGHVLAQEATPADVLRDSLYRGSLEEGVSTLQPLADEGDGVARFGLGMLMLADAVEDFVGAHVRHGFDPVRGIGQVPFFGIVVPPGSHSGTEPEAIDYEGLRAIYATFVDDLDAARAVLSEAAEGEAFVVPMDVMSIRLDFNGNGTVEKSESIGGFLAVTMGGTMAPLGGPVPFSDVNAITALPIGFDNADAMWLAGYAGVLAVQGDVLLAHDFSRTFDALFHRFFPKAGLPLGEAAGGVIFDGATDGLIADLIGAVHTLDWAIVEPERFARVPDRLREIFGASRRNWELILAETDDDNELLPSPRQTPPAGAPRVTEDMVAAWQEALLVAERVVDGDLLLPHWRFANRGFDLSAYFAEATRSDIVMILTGLDALPYLREGEIADIDDIAAAANAFGDDFFGFALWFN